MLFLRIFTFVVIIASINCVEIKWGAETDTGHWGSKHTISFPFSVKEKHYFFGVTDISGGKYWFIQELGEDGKMKSETSTGTWRYHYNQIFPFEINDKQYIFGVTDQDSRNYWFIQEILPGGVMGSETDNGYWKAMPTIIFPYSAGGRHYLYSLAGTEWFIRELLPNGKMGGETQSGSWQFKYTLGFPFYSDGKTYFYSISDTYWFIQELLPCGHMGLESDNGHWTSNHKQNIPFNIDDRQYFYGVTDDTHNGRSHWFIQELLPGGNMGAEKLHGSWQYYYDVAFAFQVKGRQFLYGHTANENYWFIQEIIQEPRLPLITSTKESYCNNETQSMRPRREILDNRTKQNGRPGLNAIEAYVTGVENDNSTYMTLYYDNPEHPLRSVSTLRVFADANHARHADITVAIRAEINYNHTTSSRDPTIPSEVYDHLREMDRQNDDEAGHLLASSLGGLAVPFNFAPQSPLVNRAVRVQGSVLPQSGWFALEDLLRSYFLGDGRNGYIGWTMAVMYRHLPVSRRPTDFYLSVRFLDEERNLVDWLGHGAVREYVFPNVPTVACSNLNDPWWQR